MSFLFYFALVSFGNSVKAGTKDSRPKITWQKCTKSGCTSQSAGIVIDANWRDIVDESGSFCWRNNWDTSVCADEKDCAQKCYLNAYEYVNAGVSTSGSSVTLKFKTPTGDIGSRVYLFDESAGTYVNFKVLNKEFTFDVDTSTLACAMNGALYFSEMDADGGTKRFPSNTAGAAYGTGYCDAQCPKDGKFVGDVANIGNKYGSCCFEFDIWEANKESTQFAGHTCSVTGPAQVCTSDCNLCDTNGCGWNHYKGDKDYYGPGLKVDTKSKFTVVTQFVTDSGTDTGNLVEIRRKYVQNGKVIENNVRTLQNDKWDSITDDYCTKAAGAQAYVTKGGNGAFTKSFTRGAVLALSLWTDGSMAWLDASDNGRCPNAGYSKDQLAADNPNAHIEFSNIKFGDIGTTY